MIAHKTFIQFVTREFILCYKMFAFHTTQFCFGLVATKPFLLRIK